MKSMDCRTRIITPILVLVAMLAAHVVPLAAAGAAEGARGWIWHPEANSERLGMPACTRYFRKIVELDEESVGGYVHVTADDEFTLWVNGHELGSGSTWREISSFQLDDVLHKGRNVIAVEVRNTAAGPAGLLPWGAVATSAGQVPIRGNATWKVADEESTEWRQADFDDSDWKNAVVVAAVDEGPWAGKIAMPSTGPVENAFQVQATFSESHLVPRPRNVRLLEDVMVLAEGFVPRFEILAPAELHDSYAIGQIERAVGIMGGGLSVELPVSASPTLEGKPRLVLDIAPVDPELAELCEAAGYQGEKLQAQGYFLGVNPGANIAAIVAADLPGLVSGSSTFIQLVRADGPRLAVRGARILDWPAWRMRGPRSIGVTEALADWCAFYKMNIMVRGFDWRKPLPDQFAESHRMLARRGILFMPECHPGGYPDRPFIFTNAEHRQALLDRTREAIALGLPAIGFMVDDRPNEPESAEDEAKYGAGLVGLGRAQMEMMTEVARLAGERIDVYFCPRVYYDPYRQSIYPTEPREAEIEYRRLVGTLPANVRIWTTQPKLSYLQELNQVWERKPVIYHNMFYSGLADDKLFFIPYPVPTEQHLALTPGGVAAGSGRRYKREWRVNYLSFAANTWNPDAALGLRPCFVREYGEAAADALVKYAVAFNGQAKPGVPIMADVWDQPDQYACVRMSFGFAGRLRHLKPNSEDIAKLRRWAQDAKGAMEIDWAGTGLDDDQIRILELNARRIWLNFAVLADILTVKMHRAAGKDVEDDAQRLRQAIARAEDIREIVKSLRVSPERAGDWKLLGRAQALAGEG